MPQTLSIAVCISDEVTLSDFITPVEILASLNAADDPVFGPSMGDVPYRIAIDYVAPTMTPVVPGIGRVGPTFKPTITYADALATGKQFDILWVPAGSSPIFISRVPKDEVDFIAQQTPKAKYVMSVCGGAYQLAVAGVLSGKRATTNKAFYRHIVASSPKDIEWIPEARWVVNDDGKIWTSSGVTAGSDMALAFLEHLTGAKTASFVRGIFEIPEVTTRDDPFAKFHGLV
ncbi:class I glutamine amidotransferase-like protein, partial [Mycena polygramma]